MIRATVNPNPMTPRFVAVKRCVRETDDVITLEIPSGGANGQAAGFQPGQFNMLYAFGVGEIPISISSDPAVTEHIAHTIRAVGPVSEALARLEHRDQVGVRGPFGSSWPVDEAAGCDVLVIAGGIGLAPLRSAMYDLIRKRERYGRMALVYGARSPDHLLYRTELDGWRRTPDLQVRVAVDYAGPEWAGDVGVVTKQLPKVRVDPHATVAMVCGPEIMIRQTAAALRDMGVPDERIFISLERNMQCAIGSCGHCQFGPHFLCKDGPVFRFDRISAILGLREI